MWAVPPLGTDQYVSSGMLVLGAEEKDVFRAFLFSRPLPCSAVQGPLQAILTSLGLTSLPSASCR